MQESAEFEVIVILRGRGVAGLERSLFPKRSTETLYRAYSGA